MPWNGLWQLSRVYTDCGLEARIDSRASFIIVAYAQNMLWKRLTPFPTQNMEFINNKLCMQTLTDMRTHILGDNENWRHRWHVSESTVHVRRVITSINASHIYFQSISYIRSTLSWQLNMRCYLYMCYVLNKLCTGTGISSFCACADEINAMLYNPEIKEKIQYRIENQDPNILL